MLERFLDAHRSYHRDQLLAWNVAFAWLAHRPFAIFMVSAAIIIFFLSLANAQEPSKDVTLTVTVAELAVIGKALGTIPYSEIAPLMNKLQIQFIAQSVPRRAEEGGGSAPSVGGVGGPTR